MCCDVSATSRTRCTWNASTRCWWSYPYKCSSRRRPVSRRSIAASWTVNGEWVSNIRKCNATQRRGLQHSIEWYVMPLAATFCTLYESVSAVWHTIMLIAAQFTHACWWRCWCATTSHRRRVPARWRRMRHSSMVHSTKWALLSPVSDTWALTHCHNAHIRSQ